MREKAYHWMVRETPEKEWVKGQGIFLWLAFFFSEIGAGIYLVSLFMNVPQGWLIGWLITLIFGGFNHLFYLGKPTRAWRMLIKPLNSELSRGFWVTFIYGVIGFFQVAPVVIPGLTWAEESLAMKTIMGILSILVISHGFLTMSRMKAIPIWNSSMMVSLSVISGIWVGSQGVELLLFALGANVAVAEIWSRWSLFGFIGVVGLYLLGAMHASLTAAISVKGILAGDTSIHFYIGVLLIGMVIPLIITLWIWESGVEGLGGPTLFLRFVCVVIGDLMMRYSILRRGMYKPIVRHTMSRNR